MWLTLLDRPLPLLTWLDDAGEEGEMNQEVSNRERCMSERQG